MNPFDTQSIAIVVTFLLVLEGIYTGSEIALLSADRLHLRSSSKQGSRGASLALELAEHPERILSTTLFVNSVCVVTISALIALHLLSINQPNRQILAVLITSPLIVFAGELFPKSIAQRHATRIAPYAAYPILWAFYVFYPITRILGGYTTKLSRAIQPLEEILTGKKRSTREELRTMMNYGKRDSEIKSSEKRMIKRILDFRDSEAQHALIPLVKVDAIAETATIREALESFQRHRHSRMPVYSERIDNIVGTLEAADLLSLQSAAGLRDLEHSIRNHIRAAHYAPEAQALEDLIRDMRSRNVEMTVVVDEYGGAVGILTFEDIVEEIVGELEDEYDSKNKSYREVAEDTWLVPAKMEIRVLNEEIRLELPEGDYETLGGFLLQQFGRIPEIGDELYFDTPKGQIRFSIKKATSRAIQQITIERLAPPPPPPSVD